jgi:hypothetical protein
MTSLEKFEKHLPQYLSYDARARLFDSLNQFPDNIDYRLYTQFLENENTVFQGDGIEDVLFVLLPSKDYQVTNVIILSNSCDINPENKRYLELNVTYSPIINLKKYIDLLENNGVDKEKIANHISQIKRQEISNIFYLPENANIDESIVFFDRINSSDTKSIYEKNLKYSRLFTLSDYGFYLFLYKIAIHFTRIWESVERRIPQ